MRSILRFIQLTLVLCMLLCASVTLHADDSDFTMVNGYVNIKARDILDIEGAFTYDETKYKRGETVIDSNTTSGEFDGQFFFHEGAGDKFTFTVDFGTFKADKFAYMGYGGAQTPTVFKVYAGSVELGSGSSEGSAGWVDLWDGYASGKSDSFSISPAITGKQTITVEIVSSSPAWPANNIGYFEFFDTEAYNKTPALGEANFIMTGETLNIPAKDIFKIRGAITRDETLFDNKGHGIASNVSAEQPEYDGQFFIHSGMGDSFKFIVDFGSKKVQYLSFMQYGAAGVPTYFEVYADSELLGTGEALGGNGWELADYELCTYDEIELSKLLTGKVSIEIRIVESAPSWPANNIGNFTFWEAENKTASPVKTNEPSVEKTPAKTPENDPTSAPTQNKTTAAPITTDKPQVKDSNSSGTLLIVIIAVVVIAIAVLLVILLKKKKK